MVRISNRRDSSKGVHRGYEGFVFEVYWFHPKGVLTIAQVDGKILTMILSFP